MSWLNPTPPELLHDREGRPYFTWDSDLTLADLRSRLADPDPQVRAYYLGGLLRQAKPDDVFQMTSPREIRALWPLLTPYLGSSREFWTWLFDAWKAQGHAWD